MMTRTRFSLGTDDGVALIEALGAALLLSVAAAALAGLSVASAREVVRLKFETVAAAAGVQKLEQLQSLAWATDPATPGAFVADLVTDLSVEPPVAGGSGLAPGGDLHSSQPRYADYLDGRGQWLAAAGGSRPRDAVFLRRWRVIDAGAPTGSLIGLEVFVTSAADPASPGHGSLRGDVLLGTLRARKAF